jgi:hypothetical protein
MSQTDTATVMYYNILNFPGTTPERIVNFRTINQYVKPDILLVNELLSDVGAVLLLEEGLNVFGESKYQKAVFIDGPDTDNMLFYNSEMFTLYSQDTIQTALRLIKEYVLYYNNSPGITDTVFFYLYSAHLKAGNTSTDRNKRLAEVMRFKEHVNSMPNIENLIIGGDFNLYSSTETAYSTLLNEGLYPLNDVLGAGNWHDDPVFAPIHTQSTRTAQFGGGATGGLDDRFDFMLFTGDLLSGTDKITYVPGSYIPVGNDGLHLNLALISPPVNTTVPDSILQALYFMADHIPIISKFAIESAAPQQNFTLSLKVFLEGPFNDPVMSNEINSLLPGNQPYDQSPWNYQGDENVNFIPNPEIIDWVLIELRDAQDAVSATPDTRLSRRAAFLLSNGSVVDTNGYSNLTFNLSVQNQLYVVVMHRNHLGVMSAFPAQLSDNIFSYDFSIASGLAYGGINGHKEIASGIWGMISGDSDGSGFINTDDKILYWNLQAGWTGYFPSDFNFDGITDNRDKDDFMIKNNQLSSQIPQ